MALNRSGIIFYLPACCALLISAAGIAAEPINAVFELRKAPNEPDTVLNPGENLNLEIYLTLSSTVPIPNVHAISWFLQLDTHEDGALVFNQDFTDESGLSHTLVNHIDNAPISGVLARAAYAGGGISYPPGQAKRIGYFSVTALDPGPVPKNVIYAFANASPQRPWIVDFVGQGETVIVSMLASPTIEVLPPLACATITQWRSVRTHGSDGELAIILDPAATGPGRSGPTTETRSWGIRKIELDFSCPVSLSNPSGVTVTGRTTSNGSLGPPTSYTPTSVWMLDADTMAISFNAGILPPETCYSISISSNTINQSLFGDTDVSALVLVGDLNKDGVLTTSDMLAVKSKLAQPAISNSRYDINVSGGAISTADLLLVKSRVINPAFTAACP